MTKNSGNSASGANRAVQTVPKNPDPDLSPKAIAARIGDRDLWIGNVGAIKSRHLAEMELNPEYVVSVNQTATEVTTDHHPLKDGYVNDQQQFRNAVAATRNSIRNEGTVLVNCSVGVSRSATVIATAIAAEVIYRLPLLLQKSGKIAQEHNHIPSFNSTLMRTS